VRAVNPSLLLLMIVWVAILLPGALRSRLRSSPRVTVGGFQRAMDGLRVDTRVPGHASAHAPAHAPQRGRGWREDPSVVRRRRRFLALLTATVLSLVLAPLVGGVAWAVAAAMLTTTVVSALVLRRLTVQRQAARSVLVSLDLRRPAQPLVDEITGELVMTAGSGAPAVRLPSWGR
jgi:hypothetical protein